MSPARVQTATWLTHLAPAPLAPPAAPPAAVAGLLLPAGAAATAVIQARKQHSLPPQPQPPALPMPLAPLPQPHPDPQPHHPLHHLHHPRLLWICLDVHLLLCQVIPNQGEDSRPVPKQVTAFLCRFLKSSRRGACLVASWS